MRACFGHCGQWRVDAAMTLSECRCPIGLIHDLRRSCAPAFRNCALISISGKLFWARRAGVVGVYDRHDYQAEKKDALERWAAYVQTLATPAAEATNVIKLHA